MNNILDCPKCGERLRAVHAYTPSTIIPHFFYCAKDKQMYYLQMSVIEVPEKELRESLPKIEVLQ